MSFYPMFASLAGKPCLVVGAGKVAERKITSLLAAGAYVTVVSLTCTASILELADAGRLTIHHRHFIPEDVREMVIVIAATNDATTNLAVHEACLPHQWVNIVDRPQLCSFVVPALVERGELQVAISTGGANPGLAKKMRRQIEMWIGPEYEAYTLFLKERRKQILSLSLSEKEKQLILRELLEDRFFQWTQTGEIERRDREAAELINRIHSNSG
jgi:precorrin-2 dehydrogenase / sirohydrochlorin ferrochelatase